MACAILTGLSAASLRAQALPYTAEIVPPFSTATTAYPSSSLHRINDHGRAIGGASDAGGPTGIYWEPDAGKQRMLVYKDLNNRHDVLGTDLMDNLETGQQWSIPPIPGYPVMLSRAVNDGRLVVGQAQDGRIHQATLYATIFAWDPVNSSRQIPIPDARDLIDVNDAGQAVGHIKRARPHQEMILVDVHTGTSTNLSRQLPPNPLLSYGYNDEVIGISENGLVIGEAFDGSYKHAFVWGPVAGFIWLPGLNGGDDFRVRPYGINSAGQVVGQAMDGNGDWRAFLWDATNGMRDLNAMATFPPNFTFQRAVRINEAGWICGLGITGNWSPSTAVVMRPAEVCHPDLGSGGPGTSRLRVCGPALATGERADVLLTGAPADTPGLYAVSFQTIPLPLLGGTLVTNPVAFTTPFTTNSLGNDLLLAAIPGGGGPSSFYLQAVMLDPSTPQSVGFSNAVQVSLLP